MSKPALGQWATETVNQRYGELAALIEEAVDRLR